MSDPERLIVEALKTMERDPEGPKSIAQATAYSNIAIAMLLRDFFSKVRVENDDDDEKGPAW